MDDTSRSAQGMTVRREVLGDAHVDRAVAGTTAVTADFQDFITRYAWGEIWSRPGLSRAERSMITLTALVVLRQDEELAMHLRAAPAQRAHPGADLRGAAAHRRVRRRSRGQPGVRRGRARSCRGGSGGLSDRDPATGRPAPEARVSVSRTLVQIAAKDD